MLAGLYAGQTGKVVADKDSKSFNIGRGTNQGDPLSPKCVNAVLEKALCVVQEEWRRKGWGIKLGYHPKDVLCNLRFADDIILLATSRRQLRLMIKDLMQATEKQGLHCTWARRRY